MKKSKSPLAVAISAACLGLAAHAAQGADAETAITIYSSAQPGAISPEFYRPIPGQGVPNAMSVPGYALVRDDRDVSIKQGRSQLSFTDVAALIDPTTVTFTSLTDPATRVLEQNFQFDLVSTQKLLLKFIDKQITVDKPNGNSVTPVTGTLLSAIDGIVLRGSDGSIQYPVIRRCAFRIFPAASVRARRWCGTSSRRAAARTSRASPIRLAASPGGPTTTSFSTKAPMPTAACSTCRPG
jgi:hypothetical protein